MRLFEQADGLLQLCIFRGTVKPLCDFHHALPQSDQRLVEPSVALMINVGPVRPQSKQHGKLCEDQLLFLELAQLVQHTAQLPEAVRERVESLHWVYIPALTQGENHTSHHALLISTSAV